MRRLNLLGPIEKNTSRVEPADIRLMISTQPLTQNLAKVQLPKDE